jgi:hypothetical protein
MRDVRRAAVVELRSPTTKTKTLKASGGLYIAMEPPDTHEGGGSEWNIITHRGVHVRPATKHFLNCGDSFLDFGGMQSQPRGAEETSGSGCQPRMFHQTDPMIEQVHSLLMRNAPALVLTKRRCCPGISESLGSTRCHTELSEPMGSDIDR